MVENATLFEHLQKLGVVKLEEEIENLLQILWRSRKTGLSALQRCSIESLVNLPSPADLDPILASLRLLIRNCALKDLEGDDSLKLLPPGLPPELQSILLILLQKYQSHWKEELSQEQHVIGQTQLSHQVNIGFSAPLLPSPSWVTSGPMSSRQVDLIPQFNS